MLHSPLHRLHTYNCWIINIHLANIFCICNKYHIISMGKDMGDISYYYLYLILGNYLSGINIHSISICIDANQNYNYLYNSFRLVTCNGSPQWLYLCWNLLNMMTVGKIYMNFISAHTYQYIMYKITYSNRYNIQRGSGGTCYHSPENTEAHTYKRCQNHQSTT